MPAFLGFPLVGGQDEQGELSNYWVSFGGLP